MINYLLEVSLCWTGFYLLYAFFLSKETFFHLNRGYLLGTLLLGMALPLTNIGDLITNSITTEESNAYYLETITVTVSTIEQNVEAVVVAPIAESLSVMDVLLWIYWLGAGLMFLRFASGLYHIARLYYNSEKVKSNGYTLILTDKAHLPFSFFHLFFRSKNIELSPTDKDKITQHELAHIRGRHSFDVILLELASIVLWCSPLVHFYKKSIRNIHEYLADANVLQTTSKKHYGQLLLQMFQSSPGIALANNFIHSQLKKRIKMMTKAPSSKRAYWKYMIALPLLGLMALALSNSTALAQDNSGLTKDIPAKTNTAINTTASTIGATDPIFTVVEEMPRFKGCEHITDDKKERKDCSDRKLLTFVQQNIKYPEAAKKAGVEGVSVIKFVIDKEGYVTAPKIVRSIGGGCDEEALRVVKQFPQFIPGKQGGKKVNVYFNLPVRFKLTDDQAKTEASPAPATDDIEGEVFRVVEDMPRFPGCEHITNDNQERKTCAQAALINFIFENISFPEEAKKAGVEGVGVVEFVVSKEGEVLNPSTLKPLGYGCDAAILNAVEQMNAMEQRWIPGKQGGKAVNVKLVLPVRFKLDPEDATKRADASAEAAPAMNNTLGVKKLTITPNPASGDEVNLSFELENKPAQLTLLVTDINGKIISKIRQLPNEMIHNTTVDISKAAPGTLIISLSDGKKVYSQKMIKAANR